ncbi:MAG: tryptophan synthase subunit alpha [Desulfovibrio sp.]
MTQSESKLTTNIQAAKAAGRLALVPFIPGGFPNREQFRKEVEELAASGADIIEIGMPFSDPVADGPVVERASLQCLEDGVNLKWIMSTLQDMNIQGPALILMGYYNPVLQHGLDKFAEDASKANVSGVIIPDIPFEESDELKAALAKYGIVLIPLVGMNTSKERMELYAKEAKGFVYFVSVLGTTGGTVTLPDTIKEKLKMTADVFDVPIALGFGLKHPDQLKELEGLVDAAVFGSALIQHIEEGQSSASFMERWTK